MTIPLDARHIANQQGDFVPQHMNHWSLEIAGLDGDDKDLIVLSLKSGALPDESNEVVTVNYGNENRKVAGKANYASMPLTVNDFVDREIRDALLRWRKQVYDPETGLVGLPSDYKKEATIIIASSNNETLRKCRLIGLWPAQMTHGNLDMSSSEVVEISMTLEYDKAIWQPRG